MTGSVLQVNSSDVGGGAEAVALSLHRAYRARRLDAWLAVGRARSGEDGVLPFGDDRSRRSRALRDPGVLLDLARGREDFRFPASHRLIGLPPRPPDVLHLHNLHGGYFDLAALPELSAGQPTVVTMHDEWLYTGHCANSLDSERWLTGCGSCPHLDSYPALRVDGTSGNWKRKAAIYERLRLHVVCPSAHLLNRAQQSMLAPAIVSASVIPNGVDLALFSPGDRDEARTQLGLPHGTSVIVFAAPGVRTNPYKDFATLRAALELLDVPVLAVALGEGGAEEQLGEARLCSEPFADRERVAVFLRAADLYVHPTRADNHPLAVLEALACGVPVVASRVGGIPEQLRDDTGILVDPGEPEALARAIAELLGDELRRREMGAAAAADARDRFDGQRHVDAYLELYAAVTD
jgi:glycosyltransferase involved in cell wall biosynthesis